MDQEDKKEYTDRFKVGPQHVCHSGGACRIACPSSSGSADHLLLQCLRTCQAEQDAKAKAEADDVEATHEDDAEEEDQAATAAVHEENGAADEEEDEEEEDDDMEKDVPAAQEHEQQLPGGARTSQELSHCTAVCAARAAILIPWLSQVCTLKCCGVHPVARPALASIQPAAQAGVSCLATLRQFGTSTLSGCADVEVDLGEDDDDEEEEDDVEEEEEEPAPAPPPKPVAPRSRGTRAPRASCLGPWLCCTASSNISPPA